MATQGWVFEYWVNIYADNQAAIFTSLVLADTAAQSYGVDRLGEAEHIRIQRDIPVDEGDTRIFES